MIGLEWFRLDCDVLRIHFESPAGALLIDGRHSRNRKEERRIACALFCMEDEGRPGGEPVSVDAT